MEASTLAGTAPNRRRAVPWQGIASITAVASLVVALAFNGFQARQAYSQAQQAERATDESRKATELQVFTQLHQLVNDSGSSVAISPRSLVTGQLSARENRGLSRAMNNMEYLAWLFESDYVQLPRAEQVWGPAMRCDYDLAAQFWSRKMIAAALPNLKLFVQSQTCPAALR